MRWGKFILIVQAIVTLIIGVALLNQVLELDDVKSENPDYAMEMNFDFIQQRFYSGSYILVLVSIIEFVIIWRLLK